MSLYVATNPPADHTDYPKFEKVKADNKRMPRMGDEFSFKLKNGEWGYHNHTTSSDIGTTEVHPVKVIVQ